MTAERHPDEYRKNANDPQNVPDICEMDSRVEALVNDVIGRVADKWTMRILEALNEHGVVRFTKLGRLVGNISQKMLTQTLRQMERDGLVARTVHPVIPPKVEYKLTELGHSLSYAFCGVWKWAEQNLDEIEKARACFDERIQREHAEGRAAR
jgi:DNA-binding HxlR family transcriptional regulator